MAKAVLAAREVSILVVVLAVFGVTTVYNSSFADLLSVQQLLVGASVMMHPGGRGNAGDNHPQRRPFDRLGAGDFRLCRRATFSPTILTSP